MKIHGDLDVRGGANFSAHRKRASVASFTASNSEAIISEITQTFPGRCDGTNNFKVTISLNFSVTASGTDTESDILVHVGTAGTTSDSTAYLFKHIVNGTIPTTFSVTFMLVGVNFPGNENAVKLSVGVQLSAATTATINRELSAFRICQTLIELVPS